MKRSGVRVLVVVAVISATALGAAALRRRMTVQPAGAGGPAAFDAAADRVDGGRLAPLVSQGGPDATPEAAETMAPDLVSVAAEIAGGLYKCRPPSQGWAAGRQVLARLELSAVGTLVRGELVDSKSGAPAIAPDASKDCVAHALAGSATDAAGESTTIWWPLVFAEATAGDGGVASSGSGPRFDLLVVPSPYPSSELPQTGLDGRWLGWCRPDRHKQGWQAVKLTRTTDEENPDFDDVAVEGCGAKPDFVPVVRGDRLVQQPASARVRPGLRTVVGERMIRFGDRRFQIWQAKLGEDRSVVVLGFGREVQVLLPDCVADEYDLTWAGDLDGDDRLDLIVRDGELDEPRFTLFVSSAAAAGLPVGRTAEAEIPGD